LDDAPVHFFKFQGFLAMPIFTSMQAVDMSIQLLLCLIGIALMGIPHGAIDHIIYMEERQPKPVRFYSFYFGLMGLYTLCWVYFPVLSFVLFLLLSAYHFGESQFSDVDLSSKPLKWTLNFAWGCSIMSGLILYNLDELIVLTKSISDIAQFVIIYESGVFVWLVVICSVSTVAALLHTFQMNKIDIERLLREFYLLILIHFCFYVLPFMIAFTLYFVTLHSARVLTEEFDYLRKKRLNFSYENFIKLLFPYTLVSVVGSAILLYLSYIGIIKISGVMLALIFISTLTLPHSFVMNDFYQKLNGKTA